MKNFAIIGVGGYIAPRHMKAIKDTGNVLLAAVDKHDSVGIIDHYFPGTAFFTEFERFDRHVEKLKTKGQKIDYFVVCSPNYLHDAHIRFALRYGADVICEKPLVLNPWNVDLLSSLEVQTNQKINTILQLRLHPEVLLMKKEIEEGNPSDIYEVELTYITSRGKWYYASWKGDESKSGGIATNIGIHFFDMLIWIFGSVTSSTVHLHSHDRAAGVLNLKRAKVKWFLSIDANALPDQIKDGGGKTFRVIKVNEKSYEFSEGFTELHTTSYQQILKGQGFGTKESLPSIQLVHDIRNAKPVNWSDEFHPLCNLEHNKHPFK